MKLNKIYQGDCLKVLKTFPSDFVDTIITSPPYFGLRDYGVEGQIGLEPTLSEYLEKLLKVTKELKRVLKPTGVMFWNHGDNYGGAISAPNAPKMGNRQHKPRPAIGIPKCLNLQNYRLILRMIDEQGWILRNSICWFKPNAMPSSVKDRFANSYENIFMLVKNKKYWFDLDAVRVRHSPDSHPFGKDGSFAINMDKKTAPTWGIKGSQSLRGKEFKRCLNPAGKNPGDVWRIPTHPFPEAHFATFPEKLVEPMIKSSCPEFICKKCGKVRVRITKPTKEYAKRLGKSWHDHSRDETVGGGQKADGRVTANYQTIGWTDCGCKAGWKAGVVLDPFIGSGTVGLVARKHGRNWIGIELSKEYIKIANKRLVQQSLFEKA